MHIPKKVICWLAFKKNQQKRKQWTKKIRHTKRQYIESSLKNKQNKKKKRKLKKQKTKNYKREWKTGYNELLGRSNTPINLDNTSLKVLNNPQTLLEAGPWITMQYDKGD